MSTSPTSTSADNGTTSKASASSSTPDSDAASAATETDTLTMCDVLEEEAALEDDAVAVLGAADHNNCSYMTGGETKNQIMYKQKLNYNLKFLFLGYATRQALYSCLTCTVPRSPDFRAAGICLACSYKCHEGHDLVELYTKRKFRCDCGNDRINTGVTERVKCKLEPEKNKENVDNRYGDLAKYVGECCSNNGCLFRISATTKTFMATIASATGPTPTPKIPFLTK
jgi:E3 ubiquitin-protein ligase UBR7